MRNVVIIDFSMASLTEVSYYTRRGVKIFIALAIAIILTPLIVRGIRKIYLALNPPAPPPPTVRYGKLPKLKFLLPEEAYKPTFRLETVDGQLPQLPTVGKVYLVEVDKSRLLQLDRVKVKARILGFAQEPEQIDDQSYRFTRPDFPAELTANLIYNTYAYKYNWTLEQSLFGAQDVPLNEPAYQEAKNFWQSLGLLPVDLAEGAAKFSYLAAQPPEMIPVSSLSEANFIRVDMYRANKDDLRFVYTRGQASPVNITLSGLTDRSKRVIEANYTYSKTVDNDSATYPLKTVQQTWDELRQNGGAVVQKAGDQVVIRKVSLAYYESEQPQEFLQPVYVFEGDGDFMAYVAAVDSTYQD